MQTKPFQINRSPLTVAGFGKVISICCPGDAMTFATDPNHCLDIFYSRSFHAPTLRRQ
ncbi:hypothetical protein FHS27_004976 [Rhodopirellula rubra]|uniref:Uncharacterized protein n=1 Tax=Aporhodopirellula rubra TaxID=980271 RepID=A0A7W5H862_9BACT|nr:hypothetical protein [Aporhodopirellula rubra]